MKPVNVVTDRDIIDALAKRIKEYRLATRMSQREMAEISGVSYTTICHFEQGRNPNLSLNNFMALLRAVGMEGRMLEVLPPLPIPPMALREINKLIPKRVRRKKE
ncbi:MAG: helix-turn-helix domain-containing protein [Muribaculaceae bacterium]|nr:helix-turn-helix domain-containing protein [Muribaculaceae bacterium]